MRRSALIQVAALVGIACVWIGIPGCMSERNAINRVQANALPKAFFVGDLADPSDDPEFYMRTTVVDVQAGAGSDGLFTNSDGMTTMRVRWEITEKLLVARLTYELIEDSDYKGARRSPDGQAVAAFTIEKHFDIKRDYNSATGEPYNVIVENDSDRPYYERDYFRVDWSRNLITTAYDFDTLSILGIYYGIKWSPVSYFVTEPGNADAPVFDLEQGYFDVTHKAYANPQVISDPWWGDYPACWLTGAFPYESCNPSEVTLRTAFRLVTDRDYEPLAYDGTQMEIFGYFTVDRYGYDRRYGLVDDKWNRFAARWNLYDRSHADPQVVCNTPETTPPGMDPTRDLDRNGTEDECEAVGRGSRCDRFRGECTVPLRDRTVRTIPWYVNREFPEELFEGTALALDGWSEAIRVAVVAGRLAECRRTFGVDCEAQMGWPSWWTDEFSPPFGNNSPAEVPAIFVLCHNPVDGALDDVNVCGPEGTSPRIGDLRYNLISIIDSPQLMSPWGIMMDAEDPLTGEKIAGSVNQWGATLDRAASTLVDLLALLNGQMEPSDFLTGEDVTEWVAANRPGGPRERGRAMSAEEIASRISAVEPQVVARYLGQTSDQRGDRRTPPGLRHLRRARAMVDSGRLGPGNAELSQRLQLLRGSTLEAALTSPDMAQLAGYDPTGPISPAAIRRASPFGRMNPSVRRELARSKRMGHARRHSCRVEALEPDNLIGLAREAARLFGSPDPNDAVAVNNHRNAVWLWARQELSKGVIAHELGHSMGLRHNFAATFDSLNYHPEYWQIRTNNGLTTAACPDGNMDGNSCVGPRWRDPITTEEIQWNINRYAITSVMDYPGDPNLDMSLQGSYDRAAVRFGYGGVVDVWSSPGLSVYDGGPGRDQAYKLTAFTTSPGLLGIYYFPPADPTQDYQFIHYSQYQNHFALIQNCQPSADPAAVMGTKCFGPPMDVVDYRDMEDFSSDPDYADYAWARNAKAIDPEGRVRRGYLFSSDEYADTGNVPSFSTDIGADAYEQIRFLEMNYENRYILDAFRRNRVQFNSWDVTGRIQYRYLDPIQLIAKTFAFGVLLDGDPDNLTPEFTQDGYYGPLVMGSTIALDLFGRILTRPEPGYYCPSDVCGTSEPIGVLDPLYSADAAALPDVWLYDFKVALGDGRYIHNDFDYGKGYWWGDYQTQVGAYYEKIWATYYLAEAFDYFISSSKEDFTDSRYKNVNFATVFPNQIRRLYANLFTGEYSTYAPWVMPQPSGDETPLGVLQYPIWHDPVSLGVRPAGAYLVDPNWAFNEQLYAMVWGAMFFPTTWSMDWINEARITVLGSDFVGWAPEETYAYYDPESGLTYRAHAIGYDQSFGIVHEKGIGARMLEWANWLLTFAYVVERDASGYPVFNANGTPNLILGADGRPQKNVAIPGADLVLRRHVDCIDILRQLTSTFERGLSDEELPQP